MLHILEDFQDIKCERSRDFVIKRFTESMCYNSYFFLDRYPTVVKKLSCHKSVDFVNLICGKVTWILMCKAVVFPIIMSLKPE